MTYEDTSTPAQELAYKFLEAYDDAINRDEFLEVMKAECPDLGLLNAIWDLIDFLRLGGQMGTISLSYIVWMIENPEKLSPMEKEWVDTFTSLFMENLNDQEVQKDSQDPISE